MDENHFVKLKIFSKQQECRYRDRLLSVEYLLGSGGFRSVEPEKVLGMGFCGAFTVGSQGLHPAINLPLWYSQVLIVRFSVETICNLSWWVSRMQIVCLQMTWVLNAALTNYY